MKKIFTLVLGSLILLSMVGCGQVSKSYKPLSDDSTDKHAVGDEVSRYYTSNGGKSDKHVTQLSSEPLIINKVSNPKSGGLYDEPICVLVEIRNNKISGSNPKLDDIYIREIVDDDFRVIDSGVVYNKLKYLNEICECKAGLFRNEQSNTLVTNIKPKDGAVFNNSYIYYPLFNWDNVDTYNETIDNTKLKDFLYEYFGVSLENASINKFDDKSNNVSFIYINDSILSNKNGNIIKLFIDENLDMNKSILILNDGRDYEFKVKWENESKIIYDWITIINIYIEELSQKDSFIFYYYIKPKKIGTFGTETIVRIYDDDYRYWPDMDVLYQIQIKDPKSNFEINPRYDKHQIYNKEIFNVIYDITYTGTGLGPYSENVLIELDKPNNNYYYVNEKGERIDNYNSIFEHYSSFITNKTISVPIYIKYNTDGVYNLPGIWINGNHKRLEDRLVTVNSEFNKIFYWLPVISIIVSIIMIFYARTELKMVHIELRSTQKQFEKLIHTLEKIEKKIK